MTAIRRLLPQAPPATWLGCLVAAGLIVVGTVLVAFSGYCEDACDRGTDWSMVRMGAFAGVLAIAMLVGAAWAAGARPIRRAAGTALASFVTGLVVLPLATWLGQSLGGLLTPGPDVGAPTGVLTVVLLGCGLLWWVGLTARLARRETRVPLFRPRGEPAG